jgi:hypothetical protein
MTADPASADVDVTDGQAQDLRRPQPARTASTRRSPGPGRCGNCPAAQRSRPDPTREANAGAPRTRSLERDFGSSRCANNPRCCTKLDRRAADVRGTGLTRAGSRITPEVEQPRDRCQPPIDRRQLIPRRPARPQRHHIPARLTEQHRRPAERQEPQQRIGCHRADTQVCIDQPPGERQQVEGIRPLRPRRIPPIGDTPQEFIHHRQVRRTVTVQPPPPILLHHPRAIGPLLRRHEMQICQIPHLDARTSSLWRVAMSYRFMD